MLSSLTSSFCVHTITFILLGQSILYTHYSDDEKSEDMYAATEQSPHVSWIPYAAQLLGVSIPFSIYRYTCVGNLTLHI